MTLSLPLERIAELANATTAEPVETIQTLWSGYGEIVRVRLLDSVRSTIVVKHVCPPVTSEHKYGWANDVSHQRKLKSYDVELNWYRDFSERCGSACRVPEYIGGESADPNGLIILEDLDASGFPIRHSRVNDAQLSACLRWLANFHATFLFDSTERDDKTLSGLWTTGTYWHLATRPDEWDAMPAGALKQAAAAIESRLGDARYQTLVHGDAKLANFCFSDDDRVAAVDFQYVGGGCGMKDVAYFISSCLNEDECERRESELLQLYFQYLRNALSSDRHEAATKLSRSSLDDLEAQWRALYSFAWADFYRFLAGWSPGHWKMHGYSERIANSVIDQMNSG